MLPTLWPTRTRARPSPYRVSFTDDAGNEETLTSAATAAVEAKPNSPATGAPAITGTAQVGEMLTADTSGIADADGLDNVAFAYQWQYGRRGHLRRDGCYLHPGRLRRGQSRQRNGELHRRRGQRGIADQRGDGRRGTRDTGGAGRQHPGHGPARHYRHCPGGREADGGHCPASPTRTA